jgi:NADH:ubiquinone oxidoreductase subunit 4 (subunit M)
MHASMTIHLSIVIFLPLVASFVLALVPSRSARWISLIGTLGVLAYWIAMLADYPTGQGAGAGGLQW